MNKPKQLGAVVLVCLALSGCAPIILGRTPQPAAPDEWVFSLNAGYPWISLYPGDPFNGPSQSPTAHLSTSSWRAAWAAAPSSAAPWR